MTIVSMIVHRWQVERGFRDEPLPDVDAIIRFCLDHFGSVPTQGQALAVRLTLKALESK